jgi:hypothetical protein
MKVEACLVRKIGIRQADPDRAKISKGAASRPYRSDPSARAGG